MGKLYSPTSVINYPINLFQALTSVAEAVGEGQKGISVGNKERDAWEEDGSLHDAS